eukprot:1594123-Rhodomonas_salina.2
MGSEGAGPIQERVEVMTAMRQNSMMLLLPGAVRYQPMPRLLAPYEMSGTDAAYGATSTLRYAQCAVLLAYALLSTDTVFCYGFLVLIRHMALRIYGTDKAYGTTDISRSLSERSWEKLGFSAEDMREGGRGRERKGAVSYTHLRAHETEADL